MEIFSIALTIVRLRIFLSIYFNEEFSEKNRIEESFVDRFIEEKSVYDEKQNLICTSSSRFSDTITVS